MGLQVMQHLIHADRLSSVALAKRDGCRGALASPSSQSAAVQDSGHSAITGNKRGCRISWLSTGAVLLFASTPAIADPVIESAEIVTQESDLALESQEESPKDTRRIIVPVPLSNPQLGSGLAVGVVWFYQPGAASRAWTTGFGAMKTSNGSQVVAAFHNMSLSNDSIRVSAAFGKGQLNIRYYGLADESGSDGESVELNHDALFVRAKGTYKVARNLFLGGLASYRDVSISERGSSEPPVTIDDSSLENNVTIFSFGPVFSFDSRDNPFYPQAGMLITAEWLQSDASKDLDLQYSATRFSANFYKAIGSKTVLASRAALCRVGDKAPFFDQCDFGSSSDLRGYVSGQYRDLASWAIQTEIRQKLFGKFGAALFGGIGGVGQDLDSFKSAKLLPAAGFGIRYSVAKDYGVNLRVDTAWGRHSHGIYVSIGEAF